MRIYSRKSFFLCVCILYFPLKAAEAFTSHWLKNSLNDTRIVICYFNWTQTIYRGHCFPLTSSSCFQFLMHLIPYEENLHARSKHRINYVHWICTLFVGVIWPHLLNIKAENTQLHRDVVCSALLVIGRLIFMFWLNKQLAMLSTVSGFALKTQLANTLNEQVKSWGSVGLLRVKPFYLNSFPLTFMLITGDLL